MSIFSPQQEYRNMNHVSYRANDTQFDDSLTLDASPKEAATVVLTRSQKKKNKKKNKEQRSSHATEEEEAHTKQPNTEDEPKTTRPESRTVDDSDEKRSEYRDDRKQKEKKEKKMSSEERDRSRAAALEDQEEIEPGKKKTIDSGREKSGSKKGTPVGSRNSSPRSRLSRASSVSSVPASPSNSATSSTATATTNSTAFGASDFSQLLVESILDQKSVVDFVGGLADKRGTLLIRFPTTTFSKAWKKRYFTLHGDALYFHEDQQAIHPSPGMRMASSFNASHSSGSGPGVIPGVVNYKDCKRIDIADFWIIQQDGAANAVAATAANNNTVAAATAGAKPEGRIYGGGQPIPKEDAWRPSFEDTFRRHSSASGGGGGGSGSGSNSSHIGGDIVVKDRGSDREKEDGPVVRGRRRSSLVNEKGSVVILLISKDKREDPIELTGINEGSLADLAMLNEWVRAINERISTLEFLRAPTSLTAMARGGREVLAFLTDTSARVLRIENKFSDLAPVLIHFRASFAHRSQPVSFIFRNCAMTDAALIALAQLLVACHDIEVDCIDLTRNVLTKASMPALHQALKANRRIRQLILDQNQIGDEGLDVLVNGPQSEYDASATANADDDDEDRSIWSSDLALSTFSCRSNGVTDAGFERFFTSILDHLSHVDSTTGVDEEEADPPEVVFAPHVLHFDRIEFEGNVVSDLGVQVLGGFLARNPGVDSVGLARNLITDEGVTHLCACLTDPQRQLRSLDLSGNQLTSVGVDRLVSALGSRAADGSTPKLLDLDLSSNPGIGVDGVARLLSLRERGVPAVQFRQLAFTVFDPEVVEARIAAGHQNQALDLTSTSNDAALRVNTAAPSQQSTFNIFSPTAMPSSNVPAVNQAATGRLDTTAAAAKVSPALMEVFGLADIHPTSAPATQPFASSNGTSTAAAPIGASGGSVNHSAQSQSQQQQPPPSHEKPSVSRRRSDRRARENDATAPRIAIASQVPSGPRAAIAPLQPPPQHVDPVASPDSAAHGTVSMEIDLAAHSRTLSGSGQLPTPLGRHPTGTPVGIAQHEEDEEPAQLLPHAPAATSQRRNNAPANASK